MKQGKARKKNRKNRKSGKIKFGEIEKKGGGPQNYDWHFYLFKWYNVPSQISTITTQSASRHNFRVNSALSVPHTWDHKQLNIKFKVQLHSIRL